MYYKNTSMSVEGHVNIGYSNVSLLEKNVWNTVHYKTIEI